MNEQKEHSQFDIRNLVRELPIGILKCSFDRWLSIAQINEGFSELSGYTAAELEERFENKLTLIIHPEDGKRVAEETAKQIENNERISLCFRIICRDGTCKWVQYSGQLFHSEDSCEILIGILIEKNCALEDGAEILSPFLKKQNQDLIGSDTVVFEWNIQSDQLTCSKNWSEEIGQASVRGEFQTLTSICQRVYPDDKQIYSQFLEEVRSGYGYATAELRFLNEKNQYKWRQISAVNLYNKLEKPVKAIGLVFDIEQRKQTMKELKSRAERDALTGLYNRKETEKRIKEYIDSKPGQLSALFMIDTDNFKQVNDSKGHMLGDMVLTEMAFGMKKSMLENDIIGRIGGDEFTIFMKNIPSKEAALKKAVDLAEMFRNLFENEKSNVQVTCSIGIALYPEDGTDFQTLYRHADQALYQAKTQGKDGYVLYSKENALLFDEMGYSTLGATIDSQPMSLGDSSDLLIYIFNFLYKMEDVDQAVNLSLEVVGKWFDVSRAYVFETTDNGQYYSNTFEWCNEGVTPEIDNLQHLGFDQTDDYMSLFDEDIFYCKDIDTLPPKQRALLAEQGICSTLQCAIWEEKEFAGFIGFDECTGVRMWTKEEVSALSLISEIMATFLQKKKMREKEQLLQEQIYAVMENKEGAICIIKEGTYEILYFNDKLGQRIPNLQLGVCCYQQLFHEDQPCDFCPLHNGGTSDIELSRYPMRVKARAISTQWMDQKAYLIFYHDISEKRT